MLADVRRSVYPARRDALARQRAAFITARTLDARSSQAGSGKHGRAAPA
ncbi:MAG: hypothetical protein ACR2FU_11510 [Streptosporangiaceae bacterium]